MHATPQRRSRAVGPPPDGEPSLESTEPRTLTTSGHPCVLTRGAHSVQTTPWLWCFQYFLSTTSCTVTKYDTVHHSSRFHIPMHGYPCMDIRVCISVHGYPCMGIHVLAGHPFFMRQDKPEMPCFGFMAKKRQTPKHAKLPTKP